MSIEENKAVVRRFVEEVTNQHRIEPLDELFSPDYTDHSGMANPPNLEGARAFYRGVFAAFPDLQFTVHDQIAEGDRVASRKTFTGTHRGIWMGVPATGRSVSCDVIDIFKVSGGRITEHWAQVDMLGLMQQLGAVPSPAASGER